MTKEEEQAKIAELKKAPKLVHIAAPVAFLLGVVTAIRMPVAAYAVHLSVGKAVLYGLLMFTCFFLCGGSLFARSRKGYIALIVLSSLPFLGLLGWTLHLLRLLLEGALTASWAVTIHCAICAVQLIVPLVLFGYLLTGQVRSYVWKPAA
jgi:hypothetical protein